MAVARVWSRRDVLRVGVTSGAGLALAGGAGRGWGRSPAKAAHVTNVLYAAHLVAESNGFFQKEGVGVELVNSPAGARSAQMLAAAQVDYVLGDTSHPQRLTEQGKPALILFVTDRKCPYANILVREELHRAGLTSLEKLVAMQPADRKWKVSVTAIGSGTWLYGCFILRSRPAGDGGTLNDRVEWIGTGGTKASLGALKTGRIDLSMAVPEAIFEAQAQGIGRVIFDVRDDAQWLSVFKGPISASGSYALRATVESRREQTQAYVTAVYRTVQWLRSASPEQVARALEPYYELMGLSRESVVKSVAWYKEVWTYDLVFTRECYDAVADIARGIKAEKTFPYEDLVDGSFVARAAGRV
jgi:NitT/TauT family transport system substrate-binding protein